MNTYDDWDPRPRLDAARRKEEMEINLRNNHPTVRDAWNQYQTVLKLVLRETESESI